MEDHIVKPFLQGQSTYTVQAIQASGAPRAHTETHAWRFLKNLALQAFLAGAVTLSAGAALAQEAGVGAAALIGTRATVTQAAPSISAIQPGTPSSDLAQQARESLDPRYTQNLKTFEIFSDPKNNSLTNSPEIHISKDAGDHLIHCKINLKGMDEIATGKLVSPEIQAQTSKAKRLQTMVVLHEAAHCNYALAVQGGANNDSKNSIAQGSLYLKALIQTGVISPIAAEDVEDGLQERYADAKALLSVAANLFLRSGNEAETFQQTGKVAYRPFDAKDQLALQEFQRHTIDLVELRGLSAPHTKHYSNPIIEAVSALTESARGDNTKFQNLRSILANPSSMDTTAHALAMGYTLSNLGEIQEVALLQKQAKIRNAMFYIEASHGAEDPSKGKKTTKEDSKFGSEARNTSESLLNQPGQSIGLELSKAKEQMAAIEADMKMPRPLWDSVPSTELQSDEARRSASIWRKTQALAKEMSARMQNTTAALVARAEQLESTPSVSRGPHPESASVSVVASAAEGVASAGNHAHFINTTLLGVKPQVPSTPIPKVDATNGQKSRPGNGMTGR